MSSYPEFGGDFSHLSANHQLIAQADRIGGLALAVLEDPTWQQVQLRTAIPFGSDHELELEARTSSKSLPASDFRKVGLRRTDREDARIYPLMVSLGSQPGTSRYNLHQAPAAFALIHEVSNEVDPDILQFVQDTISLPGNPDAELYQSVSGRYADFLSQGNLNERRGFVHNLRAGGRLLCMTSTKQGDQPWPSIDNEPYLQIRSETGSGKRVEFRQRRDGSYESWASRQSTADEAQSLFGTDKVISVGDHTVIADLGDNDAKQAVMEEAERAMGLRVLTKPQLDIIESTLRQAAAER